MIYILVCENHVTFQFLENKEMLATLAIKIRIPYSLIKSTHGQSTLHFHEKRGGALFQMFKNKWPSFLANC